MKLVKKLAVASMLTVAVSAVAVNAAETKNSSDAVTQTASIYAANQTTTGGGGQTTQTSRPEVTNVKTNQEGNTVYLTFKVAAAAGIDEVRVEDKDGHNQELISDDSVWVDIEHEYKFAIKNDGKYKIIATDVEGRTNSSKEVNVTIKKEAPKVTLDTKKENGKTYITIKGTAYEALKSVTVKGSKSSKTESISLTSSQKKAGTIDLKYEVKTSDTYTVEVTDAKNNKTEETINVGKAPELSLVETSRDGKHYIKITVKGNNDINLITVNDTKVNGVNAKDGTYEYEVTSNGNYVVKVKNNANEETTQTITVNSIPVQTMQTVKFKLNDKNWTINGAAQPTMDAAPIVRNGRTYLPIRYTSYALGIDSSNISWDNATKTATINNNGNVIKIKINSTALNVNGATTTMDGAAFEMGGRVYIPISQVSKAFSGVSMNWNNTLKEVTIQYMG